MRLSTSDEYFRLIKRELADGERLGVSALAHRIDRPVASVFKYLTKSGQTSFIQNQDKKWALATAAFGIEAWPLLENEKTPEEGDTAYELINNPIENISHILENIKQCERVADIYQRKADFLRQLVELELKKRSK